MKILSLLVVLLLTGCGDSLANDSEFSSTSNIPTENILESICGNNILEPGEECDSGSTPSSNCSQCSTNRTIFVTSSTFDGIQIGNNIDFECEKAAKQGNLYTNKNWKAWISTKDNSISNNIFQSTGVYVNQFGEVIAYSWTDLTDGSINVPIRDTELKTILTNELVWTGTDFNGSGKFPLNCMNWSINNETSFGQYGNTSQMNTEWTSQGRLECNNSFHVYCIEDKIIE